MNIFNPFLHGLPPFEDHRPGPQLDKPEGSSQSGRSGPDYQYFGFAVDRLVAKGRHNRIRNGFILYTLKDRFTLMDRERASMDFRIIRMQVISSAGIPAFFAAADLVLLL